MVQTVKQQVGLPPAISIEGLGEGTLLSDFIIGSSREDTITANCSRWVQKVQRIYDKLKEGVGNK